MASLQKPDETFKGRPEVSSKTKSIQDTAPEPNLKPSYPENKPHLYGTRGKEPGFKKQTKIEQKRCFRDSLEPDPNFACGIKPSSAAAGEPEPVHGETRTAIKNVHDMLILAGFLPDPCQTMNSESDIVPHNQLAEEMNAPLATAIDATCLDTAKPGQREQERRADLEFSGECCETSAKPVSETPASETMTERTLDLSSSLQTTDIDGPKTVTDKIQKKQAHAATAENPVTADIRLDPAQEKAQKTNSAKAMSKKSALPQAAVDSKGIADAAAVSSGKAAAQQGSYPAAAEDQGTPQIDTSLEAQSEEKAAAAAKQAKASPPRQGFKQSEFIVYPAHGVGQIIAIEEQEVAGFKLELFVISFVKDKMILKVPTPKAVSVRMRKLADAAVVKKSLDTLTGRARVKRTMWSRRAQEYEAKINSGDLIAIAEVVRDLYRSSAQPEQSYSERQLYEAALDRMAREIAAVEKLSETDAFRLLDTQLQKSPRRVKGEEPDVEETDTDEDGNVEEAA